MNNIIELNSVTKYYRRGSETITAVNNVSLTVVAGEFVAIVGPSGSGKTTLMNLIGCVDKPDTGTLLVDSQETGRLDDDDLTAIRARKIGFVFQQFFLLPTLTACENVQLPALFLRDREKQQRNQELLKRVGLRSRTHHLPSQLSGGEMQRVAIARALVNEPMILLADEPTGNLDTHSAETILEIFRELNADGLTILMVTHNVEIARLTRRVIMLKDGQIVPSEATHQREIASQQ